MKEIELKNYWNCPEVIIEGKPYSLGTSDVTVIVDDLVLELKHEQGSIRQCGHNMSMPSYLKYYVEHNGWRKYLELGRYQGCLNPNPTETRLVDNFGGISEPE